MKRGKYLVHSPGERPIHDDLLDLLICWSLKAQDEANRLLHVVVILIWQQLNHGLPLATRVVLSHFRPDRIKIPNDIVRFRRIICVLSRPHLRVIQSICPTVGAHDKLGNREEMSQRRLFERLVQEQQGSVCSFDADAGLHFCIEEPIVDCLNRRNCLGLRS